MVRKRLILLAFIFAQPALGQTLRERLDRYPDLTCSATIERSRKEPGHKDFDLIDRARLQLSYVDRRDSMAWPGGDPLPGPLAAKLTGGSIGIAEFPYQANELLTQPDRAVAAAAKFDPVTGSLQKLQIERAGDGRYQPATVTLEYLQLMPVRAEVYMEAQRGAASKVETRFSDCHAVTPKAIDDTSAVIKLQESASESLPESFESTLTLDSEIDSNSAAAGDLISAQLTGAVRHKGNTILPKGAKAIARIVRLELVEKTRIFEFALLAFEFDGKRLDFSGRANYLVLSGRAAPSRRLLLPPGTRLALRSLTP